MKVDEQTKASAQATKLMLVQLQVDAIKKALLKLTPTNIINDFQQFFIRMKKSTTAYCNQCRTSSHNTSECRSKKEHREQALLAGARAKEVQKYGAAKSAKVLAEKKTAYLKTVECHNCHKLGHYKNQCPMQEKSSKGILGGAVVGKE
jgi:ribosomal protein L44E